MVQAEPEAGYRHAFVMFGYKGGVVAWTPAPWWQLQVIDLSRHKIDRPAAKALRIGANPNSPGAALSGAQYQVSRRNAGE